MNDTKLGLLSRVELRDAWKTEAGDFTPWLAQEENIKILADTVQIDLEFEAQEKNVGPFRADILCKDSENGSWVLIENQLERTDHTHLGQLLTYASGLDAVTIIWIASQFSEEHRAAMDWLNDITDESFRFFGLEVELWRIGESTPAPRFNIISKPNDWTRSISRATRSISSQPSSPLRELQLNYWTKCAENITNSDCPLNPHKSLPQAWTEFGIGRSGFMLAAVIHNRQNRLRVELYIDPGDPYFYLLQGEKEEIENEFGGTLDWQELPAKRASRVAVHKENVNIANEDEWPAQHAWIAEQLAVFNRIFRDRIKALNADDYDEET
ncbi:DUF4268 domain-containing protein [Candidatus Neomarinimicrobiota bacterium]